MEDAALMSFVPGAKQYLEIVVLSAFVIQLMSCAVPVPVPVRDQSGKEERPPVRVVRKGETLYSIAWDTNNDPRVIAKLNNLDSKDRINAGQRLRIPSSADKPKSEADNRKKAQSINGNIDWVWPAKSNVTQRFDPKLGKMGIEITGQDGQIISSAAHGKVVYAGDGLRGYGKLLIIKHNEEYLSAYAHNRRLLVREGDWVDSGQAVAEMGSSGSNTVKLHFEIRRNGDPVDPKRYLPKI